MKPHFVLFVVLILFSCKEAVESPTIIFEEPLPENGKNIHFPKKLLGDYKNEDSTILTILQDKIIKKTVFHDTIGRQLKINLEKNDSLNYYFSDLTFTKLADTLFLMKNSKIDTIFNLKKGDILRKLKGHYIMNYKYHENYYIKKLTYKNGFVNIQPIDSIEILNQLEIMTEVVNDSIGIPLKAFPTKNQFKRLIKSEGFNRGETYLKFKN